MCLSPNCLMPESQVYAQIRNISFLHCNKSLLYTVPFCKSQKASFICLVQQLEAPKFPREISAFITWRKVLLFESTILFQSLTADLNH